MNKNANVQNYLKRFKMKTKTVPVRLRLRYCDILHFFTVVFTIRDVAEVESKWTKTEKRFRRYTDVEKKKKLA